MLKKDRKSARLHL